MFISDIKRKYLLRMTVLLGVSLFCVLFSGVYGQFSHGVSSFFMTFLFLPSLADGLIQLLMFLLRKRSFLRLEDNLLHGGTAALTFGFLLRGIFEIAGTDSPYLAVYFLLGILFWVGVPMVFCIRIVSRKGAET